MCLLSFFACLFFLHMSIAHIHRCVQLHVQWTYKESRKEYQVFCYISFFAFSQGTECLIKIEFSWWLRSPKDPVPVLHSTRVTTFMAKPGFLCEFWRLELRSLIIAGSTPTYWGISFALLIFFVINFDG